FEAFDYATALQVAEDDFWNFCDHYLELVKLRSYSEEDTAERRSAMAALAWGLKTFLKLLAPFLPYVTEEVWSWAFAADQGRDRSIHTSAWPTEDEVSAVDRPEHEGVFEAAVELLATIRGAKTKAQKSLRWPVSKLEIAGPEVDRKALQVALEDVLRAGHVDPEAVTVSDGPSPDDGKFSVTVELAETMPE
ncbi:MAG: class I tRNA ligase family protein, partial [Acidobacteria bacterium]|nr:class I tRNA ligase family protein [Acidobacteriota bacterium]